MPKRKICVVLVDRANYGRLKPAMRIIAAHSALHLQVLAVGTMVLERFDQPHYDRKRSADYYAWRMGRFWLHRLQNPRAYAAHNWLGLPREKARWWRECGKRPLCCGLTPPAAPCYPCSNHQP
jgi:hypothetical protein